MRTLLDQKFLTGPGASGKFLLAGCLPAKASSTLTLITSAYKEHYSSSLPAIDCSFHSDSNTQQYDSLPLLDLISFPIITKQQCTMDMPHKISYTPPFLCIHMQAFTTKGLDHNRSPLFPLLLDSFSSNPAIKPPKTLVFTNSFIFHIQ